MIELDRRTPENEGKPCVSTSKSKRAGEADELPPTVEIIVWVLFVGALLATAYVLINEPEEGPPNLAPAAANSRYLAMAAAAIGASVGVRQILREGGARNLFAMATVLNLIMASFWALRFILA